MWRSWISERYLLEYPFQAKKKDWVEDHQSLIGLNRWLIIIIVYFFSVSGIGDLRNGNDANCTYEGENNVLVQQTSNWLLQVWSQWKEKKAIPSSPLGSFNFITQSDEILRTQFSVRNVS